MKKNVQHLIMAMAVFFCIISCKEEKDNHEEQWMIANIEAINNIKANPEYKEILSPGDEGSIYYKVLKAGEGTDTIRYTSSVSCYYKGWMVADYAQYNIKAGNLFDQHLFDDGPPNTFYLTGINSVIGGWKAALQHMVKGDKWEIWIPYQLGYGRAGKTDSNDKIVIPGYSTLVFEIEVMNVVKIDD